jgi:hypothetical protein
MAHPPGRQGFPAWTNFCVSQEKINKGNEGYMGVRVKARIVPSPGFFPKKSKKTEK